VPIVDIPAAEAALAAGVCCAATAGAALARLLVETAAGARTGPGATGAACGWVGGARAAPCPALGVGWAAAVGGRGAAAGDRGCAGVARLLSEPSGAVVGAAPADAGRPVAAGGSGGGADTKYPRTANDLAFDCAADAAAAAAPPPVPCDSPARLLLRAPSGGACEKDTRGRTEGWHAATAYGAAAPAPTAAAEPPPLELPAWTPGAMLLLLLCGGRRPLPLRGGCSSRCCACRRPDMRGVAGVELVGDSSVSGLGHALSGPPAAMPVPMSPDSRACMPRSRPRMPLP